MNGMILNPDVSVAELIYLNYLSAMLKDSEFQIKVYSTTTDMLLLSHTRYPVQDESGFRQTRFDSFSCLNQRHKRCGVYHFTAEYSALCSSALLTKESLLSLVCRI